MKVYAGLDLAPRVDDGRPVAAGAFVLLVRGAPLPLWYGEDWGVDMHDVVDDALRDTLGPGPWTPEQLAEAVVRIADGTGPLDFTGRDVGAVHVARWDELGVTGLTGDLFLTNVAVTDPSGLADVGWLSLMDTLLTSLPERKEPWRGSFRRAPLDEESAPLLDDQDADSLPWCREVAPLGLVARVHGALVAFTQPGRAVERPAYAAQRAHRPDQARRLIAAGATDVLLQRPAPPPLPELPEPMSDHDNAGAWSDLTSADPQRWVTGAAQLAGGAPSTGWVEWVATHLRYAPEEVVAPLVATLVGLHDPPPSPALVATLYGHFVFMASTRRLALAPLHRSTLLDEETRSWLRGRMAEDRSPAVREVLGLDPWAGWEWSDRLRASLDRIGASWVPERPPLADFPAPFDQLGASLHLPDDWLVAEGVFQPFGWDPAPAEQPVLVADPRRWVRIGACGDHHEAHLALEGDDPPVVVLDHDGSDDRLHPLPFSRWLRTWRSS